MDVVQCAGQGRGGDGGLGSWTRRSGVRNRKEVLFGDVGGCKATLLVVVRSKFCEESPD